MWNISTRISFKLPQIYPRKDETSGKYSECVCDGVEKGGKPKLKGFPWEFGTRNCALESHKDEEQPRTMHMGATKKKMKKTKELCILVGGKNAIHERYAAFIFAS